MPGLVGRTYEVFVCGTLTSLPETRAVIAGLVPNQRFTLSGKTLELSAEPDPALLPTNTSSEDRTKRIMRSDAFVLVLDAKSFGPSFASAVHQCFVELWDVWQRKMHNASEDLPIAVFVDTSRLGNCPKYSESEINHMLPMLNDKPMAIANTSNRVEARVKLKDVLGQIVSKMVSEPLLDAL